MKKSLMKIAPCVLMPYGKHKGKDIASVPPEYLQWFLANCRANRAVREAIEQVLNPQTGQEFTFSGESPVKELSALAEAIESTNRTLTAIIERKCHETNTHPEDR